MLKDLRAYGLVAAGIVCGLVWSGACSSSSSSSALPQQAAAATVVHLDSQGPFAVAAGAGLVLLSSRTFTPTDSSDLPLGLELEVTATAAAVTVDGNVNIQVFDNFGALVFFGDLFLGPGSTSYASTVYTTTLPFTFIETRTGLGLDYPFTVEVRASEGSTTQGYTLDTVDVKLIMLENTNPPAVSPNFS